MKKIFYFVIFSIFLFLLFFSCKNSIKKTTIEKYREINPVKEIIIRSNKCDLEIIGYHKDFIEIEVKRTLYSGLIRDIDLISIRFLKDNDSFIINGNVPARINGNLFLRIFVPFVLLKLELYLGNSNITISKFPGNIFVKNENGEVSVDFYGSLLRIFSKTGDVNLNLRSSDNIDAVVQNEEGNIKVNLYQVGEVSFLDIINKKGETVLNLFKNIDHELLVSARSKDDVFINYNLKNLEFIEGIPSFIKGSTTYFNNSKHTKISITSNYGKLNIYRAKIN